MFRRSHPLRRSFLCALAAALHLPLAFGATGPALPPLRLVSPFMEGSDAARAQHLLAGQLERALGRTVVLEHRPGPLGPEAPLAVLRAPADGNTLLVATSSQMVARPVLVPGSGYDPARDFLPVHALASAPSVWFVAADSPYRTMGDLVAAGRAREIRVGTYVAGLAPAVRLMGRRAGARLEFVRQPRMAQVAVALVRHQIDAGVSDLGVALPLIRSGMLRPLAVSGPARLPLLPDVRTLDEDGLADGTVPNWTAVFVRAGTPPDAIRTLAAATREAVSSPSMVRFFTERGRTPMPDFGPARTAWLLAHGQARFRRIVREAGTRSG